MVFRPLSPGGSHHGVIVAGWRRVVCCRMTHVGWMAVPGWRQHRISRMVLLVVLLLRLLMMIGWIDWVSATVRADHVLRHRRGVYSGCCSSILVGVAVAHPWLGAIVVRSRGRLTGRIRGWVLMRRAAIWMEVVVARGWRISRLSGWVFIVWRIDPFGVLVLSMGRIVHPVTRGTHSCASLLI